MVEWPCCHDPLRLRLGFDDLSPRATTPPSRPSRLPLSLPVGAPRPLDDALLAPEEHWAASLRPLPFTSARLQTGFVPTVANQAVVSKLHFAPACQHRDRSSSRKALARAHPRTVIDPVLQARHPSTARRPPTPTQLLPVLQADTRHDIPALRLSLIHI